MIQNDKIKTLENNGLVYGRQGFTIIELLVVVSIMVMMATAIVIDLASQRDSRNIRIAQSNLVTKIRSIQSYALSGRNLGNRESVQYYLMKFDSAQPNQYTVQAMYNVESSPQLEDIETVAFPANIRLAAVNPIVIDRSLTGKLPATDTPAAGGCALVAFSIPFGQVFFSDGCSPTPLTTSPYSIVSSDSYQKVLNFVMNTDNSLVSTDSSMTITVTNSTNTISNKVIINGINGTVSFQ